MKKAWILNIGAEVLSGKVVNKNAADIAIFLSKYNIIIDKIIVVSDKEEDILNIIKQYEESSCDLLITTGGLGPTHDDITREVIAKALNKPLVYSETAKKDMYNYFKKTKKDCNIKQLYFPQDAIIINNLYGSADGFIINDINKVIICLVGVPFEMIKMLEGQVNDYLNKFKDNMFIKEFYLMGESEANFEEILKPLIKIYPDINITLYCSIESIRLQVSTEKNEKHFNEVIKEIEKLLCINIIANENITIEELVVNSLIKYKMLISCAESCTGGLLASTIINVSGASSIIKESYITYTNDIKRKLFNVNEDTLLKYSAVSEEVVIEMVEGLYEITKSQICVAITGYAGDGPIPGLIFYAIKFNEKIIVEKIQLHGTRNIVRLRAVKYILYQIYLLLKGN